MGILHRTVGLLGAPSGDHCRKLLIFEWNIELSVGIATGYVLDVRDYIPGRGKIVPSSTTSTPALGPTHRPIQWVPCYIPGRKSRRGVKLTTHLHLVQR
jgi:hypothetical protein